MGETAVFGERARLLRSYDVMSRGFPATSLVEIKHGASSKPLESPFHFHPLFVSISPVIYGMSGLWSNCLFLTMVRERP